MAPTPPQDVRPQAALRLLPEQWGLALVTLAAVVGGIVVVALLLAAG